VLASMVASSGIKAQKDSLLSVAEKKENSSCLQGEIDSQSIERIGKCLGEEAGR
jgi:hypothetical protein